MLLESDFYHNLSASYAVTGEAMLEILKHRTYYLPHFCKPGGPVREREVEFRNT